IGFDDMTAEEDRVFRRQVELAVEYELPILIHTPHRDKKRGTERTVAIVKEMGVDPGMVLVDHNNEETIRITLDSGCWAGHSIYPDTKMDEARMVKIVEQFGAERVIINSAADWGVSDPLKVPKTAEAMLSAGIARSVVETIVWANPVAFFGQSRRLTDIDNAIAVDQRELFEGNSVLRGQAPKVS